MNTSLSSFTDVLAGISLALILQTSYRFDIGIGIGEIGLAAATLAGLCLGYLDRLREHAPGPYTMARLLLAYCVLALAPATFLYSAFGVTGSSVRDLLAYALSFAFVFSLASRRTRVPLIFAAMLIVLIPTLVYQYAAGGEQAWYWERFTGGARNPNQLALYVVCSVVLAALFVTRWWLLVPAIAVLVYFGVATQSDAFLAYTSVVLITALLAFVLPRKYFFVGWFPLLVSITFALLVFGPAIADFTWQQWVSADQGFARLTLYENGIRAWLSTPFSFLVGNGAGYFSGIAGPFEAAEAHNTPIDLLAMGGLLGLAVVYYFPLRNLAGFYALGSRAVFSLYAGVVVFTMFHFVARHPVFWFTVYASAWAIDRRSAEAAK